MCAATSSEFVNTWFWPLGTCLARQVPVVAVSGLPKEQHILFQGKETYCTGLTEHF